ncbi:MAG TPA: carboxypeptidase-like regulatory domain-containing protein, partial [Chryseolinea sp.]|nr:carboxypeptidase-like regulatory domain-containing protein [Chryseolinea sp.]
EIPSAVSTEQNARGAEAEEVQIAKAKPEEQSIPSSKKVELKEYALKDSRKKEADAASGFIDFNSADKSITNNKRTIKGHVSSLEDGSALPGVNVIVKGTEVGTVTDAEGNYEITLADIKDELVFSFIGLESTEINAGSSDQLDVQMSNDISELSEVVVTGYATNRDASENDEDKILELASPVGGRKAYKQYLDKNLRYPVVALENKIEGKVTIEFTVGTTGALSEFKVVRGLGYGCDEEVIRLVKDGPLDSEQVWNGVGRI